MLSSPSEGRPLAAVIINDCWIPWFISSELSATFSHSDLIGGFPLSALSDQHSQISILRSAFSDQHSQISTLKSALSDQHSQISTFRSALSDQHSQISTLRSAFSDQYSQISILRSALSDQHSQISISQITLSQFSTHRPELSATSSHSDIRIGFRYQHS